MFDLQKLMKRHYPKPAHDDDGLATLHGAVCETGLGKIHCCAMKPCHNLLPRADIKPMRVTSAKICNSELAQQKRMERMNPMTVGMKLGIPER
jgi:hypothetical protein